MDDGAWSDLELVRVEDGAVWPGVEQFTVTFRGSPHVPMAEGLYDVAPPDGEPIYPLHLQEAGSDSDGTYYRASFGLLLPIGPGCAGAQTENA